MLMQWLEAVSVGGDDLGTLGKNLETTLLSLQLKRRASGHSVTLIEVVMHKITGFFGNAILHSATHCTSFPCK